MKYPRPEKEKIIKDVKNPFRLKKKINHTAIKNIISLFRQKKKLRQLNYMFRYDVVAPLKLYAFIQIKSDILLSC